MDWRRSGLALTYKLTRLCDLTCLFALPAALVHFCQEGGAFSSCLVPKNMMKSICVPSCIECQFEPLLGVVTLISLKYN